MGRLDREMIQGKCRMKAGKGKMKRKQNFVRHKENSKAALGS